MNATYLTAVEVAAAIEGAGIVTHLGLFDGASELSGGGYARLAVTWDRTGGDLTPSTDLDFSVAAGATVDGWRGFSALTGGTDYGGAALTAAAFSIAGTYRLLKASTSIPHTALVPV